MSYFPSVYLAAYWLGSRQTRWLLACNAAVFRNEIPTSKRARPARARVTRKKYGSFSTTVDIGVAPRRAEICAPTYQDIRMCGHQRRVSTDDFPWVCSTCASTPGTPGRSQPPTPRNVCHPPFLPHGNNFAIVGVGRPLPRSCIVRFLE
jgi:hypothetical protein